MLVEPVHHVVGGDRTRHVDREALSRELVDDVEHLEWAQVARLVELKVHGPDHVGSDGTHRPHLDANARQALLALAIRDFEALFTPQTLDFLVIDAPTLIAQRVVAAAPAPTRVLLGEVTQEGADLLFTCRMTRWGESLGGATLANDDAGSSLGHPELTHERDDHSTT